MTADPRRMVGWERLLYPAQPKQQQNQYCCFTSQWRHITSHHARWLAPRALRNGQVWFGTRSLESGAVVALLAGCDTSNSTIWISIRKGSRLAFSRHFRRGPSDSKFEYSFWPLLFPFTAISRRQVFMFLNLNGNFRFSLIHHRWGIDGTLFR